LVAIDETALFAAVGNKDAVVGDGAEGLVLHQRNVALKENSWGDPKAAPYREGFL